MRLAFQGPECVRSLMGFGRLGEAADLREELVVAVPESVKGTFAHAGFYAAGAWPAAGMLTPPRTSLITRPKSWAPLGSGLDGMNTHSP